MAKSNRPARIVMVLENNTYPFDVRVRSEAETLADAGYRVAVICPRGRGQPWHDSINGVRIFRYPHPPAGRGVLSYVGEFGLATLGATLMVLWRWLRDGLDVVHVHNPPDTLFVAGLLPRLAGKKLVYDHHDLSPELYQSKYETPSPRLVRLLLRLERWSCRFASQVIAVNESYRQNDIERNGVSPDRVVVIRNGPDLQRLVRQPADPDLRSRANTVIAYLGNMARQDGIDHLLRALGHLGTDLGYRDWYCVLIGRSDDPDGLARLAEELGVASQVWLPGYVPDDHMLRILSTADICVVPDPLNPLNVKSTMNKVMEYMALGKPVVAYDLPEHRVSAGDAALYARPNDPLDMARQMAALIDDPARRARLGAIGSQRVEAELAWPHSAERLLAFYASLTGRAYQVAPSGGQA